MRGQFLWHHEAHGKPVCDEWTWVQITLWVIFQFSMQHVYMTEWNGGGEEVRVGGSVGDSLFGQDICPFIPLIPSMSFYMASDVISFC